MAIIICIETSDRVCSTAVIDDGVVVKSFVEETPMSHATALSDFVKAALDSLRERELKPDAIAVGIGPGSYTGLRIGLSEAKGLAYALDVPLIGINTLELLAVAAMFSPDYDGEALFVPMLDARRMEVYTAVYDAALTPLLEPQPLILEPDSLTDILAGRKALVVGPGAKKAKDVLTAPGLTFLDEIVPLAADMTALADRAWRDKAFIDTAYSTPTYLKSFQATKPRNPLNSQI